MSFVMNRALTRNSDTETEQGSRPKSNAPHEAAAIELLDSGRESGAEDGFIDSERPGNTFSHQPRTSIFDVEVEDTTDNGRTIPTPDVNVYQHKKTLAQGMMDLALLSANANQLRYVLETGKKHPYFYVNVVLIGISLVLQIAVGVGLILNSRYNVKKHDDMCKANSFNNFTVIGIFIVTIVNVFISAFGVAGIEVEP